MMQHQKNYLLTIGLLLCSLVFLSCQKPAGTNLPPDPNPTPTPILPTPEKLTNLVTSITIHNTFDHIYGIDSFEYSTSNRIATFHSWNFDSSQTPFLTDTTLINFYFRPYDSLPYQYRITTNLSHSNFNASELHQLTYDALRRIELDSLTNPVNNILKVNKYSYSNSSFIVNFYQTDSTAGGKMMLYESDTSYIAGGNIDHKINASIYYTPFQSYMYYYQYTYSAITNPFYFESTAKTIAPLFQNLLYGDFTSSNLVNSIEESDGGAGSAPVVNTYVWTTDAKGRVIRGTGGQSLNDFTYDFRYKN